MRMFLSLSSSTYLSSKGPVYGWANISHSGAVQISFLTQTVFASGPAPTVTITPLAETITQSVMITMTMTMTAPAAVAPPPSSGKPTS